MFADWQRKSTFGVLVKTNLKPRGDITTNLIKSIKKKVKAQIVAKQDGVIAGLELCKAAFRLTGREVVFTKKISDGTKIKKNRVIAEIKAYTNTILIAEKILVMSEGKLVGFDNHQNLLSNNKIYQQLFSAWNLVN